jgi:hypothetical protein
MCSVIHNFYVTMYSNVGQLSVVSIATRYGLDGRGTKSGWGRDILYWPRSAPGPTQPPLQWVPDLLVGRKAVVAWRGVDHLPYIYCHD